MRILRGARCLTCREPCLAAMLFSLLITIGCTRAMTLATTGVTLVLP